MALRKVNKRYRPRAIREEFKAPSAAQAPAEEDSTFVAGTPAADDSPTATDIEQIRREDSLDLSDYLDDITEIVNLSSETIEENEQPLPIGYAVVVVDNGLLKSVTGHGIVPGDLTANEVTVNLDDPNNRAVTAIVASNDTAGFHYSAFNVTEQVISVRGWTLAGALIDFTAGALNTFTVSVYGTRG